MSDFIIENGVLIKYKGSEEAVVIPNGVTEIGEGAFSDAETAGIAFNIEQNE